ncbi:MAG: copper homeostasis protein CutC [Gemmatimonas sp.]|uniref:copper homeostasis protein CutC n=1 Tax=Gemmatimonas sp. TaxID=1962908 RepID=UPI0039191872
MSATPSHPAPPHPPPVPSFGTVLVEACCDSVYTAVAAQEAGAGRIELCGPGDGGTTPSLGLMARCRDVLRVPLHVMIRPHSRDFVYHDDELDVMANDIVTARTLGMDGVVLGPLQRDDTVHLQHLVTLTQLARPMAVAFHRAFDRTPDPFAALHTLMHAGVTHVLTSGQAATALDGAATLSALRQRAGDRLTILAGGGVRGPHVRELVQRSTVHQVHARGTDPTIIREVVQALGEG